MRYLTLLALLLPLSGLSQSINGVKFADIPHQYATILGESIPFKPGKTNVWLDFGVAYGDAEAKITDIKGQPVAFKSMTDALNFMESAGYEISQAFGVNNGSMSFYHYIMKRKPKSS